MKKFLTILIFLIAAVGWFAALGYTRAHWQTVSHVALVSWLVAFLLPAVNFAVQRREPVQATVFAYIALASMFTVLG